MDDVANNNIRDNDIWKIVFPMQVMLGNIIYGLRAARLKQLIDKIGNRINEKRMFCIKCGQILSSEARYCCKCGARVQMPICITEDIILEKAEEILIEEDHSAANMDELTDRSASFSNSVAINDAISDISHYYRQRKTHSTKSTAQPTFRETSNPTRLKYPKITEVKTNGNIALVKRENEDSGVCFYIKNKIDGTDSIHFQYMAFAGPFLSYIIGKSDKSGYNFYRYNEKCLLSSVFPQDFTSIRSCRSSFVVERDGKYGHVVADKDPQSASIILEHKIPCIFDVANDFTTTGIGVEQQPKETRCALVVYHGSSYYLSPSGWLYGRDNSPYTWVNILVIIWLGSALSAIVGIVLHCVMYLFNVDRLIERDILFFAGLIAFFIGCICVYRSIENEADELKNYIKIINIKHMNT